MSTPQPSADVSPRSIGGFLDAVASDEPTPGGGAVSGIAAALAAGLAAMAGRYALRRDPDSTQFAGLVTRADALRKRAVAMTHANAAPALTSPAASSPGPAGRPRPDVTGFPRRDRALVMGIVNVTPDSFSDGGSYLAPASAIEHGLALARSGADILDVGGESTRPGAGRVTVQEELRRVLPVVRALAAAGLAVTIDTTRAPVAEAALEAGAAGVNDVSGGLADPAMARLAASARVPYIAMHWRGPSRDMQRLAVYGDVVAEVTAELRARRDALVAAGIDRRQLVLDPGIGFGKQPEHNWALLNRLSELATLGQPLLIGASRKAFLGAALRSGDRVPPPAARDAATAAVSALAAAAGAYCVRVHDVPATLDAVRVAAEWRRDLPSPSYPYDPHDPPEPLERPMLPEPLVPAGCEDVSALPVIRCNTPLAPWPSVAPGPVPSAQVYSG